MNEQIKKKANEKYCIVPMCPNTTGTAPNKLYFSVPNKENLRKEWCNAMKRDVHKSAPVSYRSRLYCCEDHFNLEEDMDNFWEYKLMKNIRARLKQNTIPHIFECQNITPTVKVSIERQETMRRKRMVEQTLEAVEKASSEACQLKSTKISVKGESQTTEDSCIKSEAFNNFKTVLLKTAAEKSIKQEISVNTNLLHANIKEEPTVDSSINQTNEHHGSVCVPETNDSLYIKQYITDMKNDLNSEDNANLIDIEDHAIIKRESYEDILQKYQSQVKMYEPKTGAERTKAYRARKKARQIAERSEKAKPKTSAERVKDYRHRKLQELKSNQSHSTVKTQKTNIVDNPQSNTQLRITIKNETETKEDNFIKSEVFNNVETVWLKNAEEKSIKQEFPISENLLQVNIKEEPIDDSTINQTNEHRDTYCAAETVDSLYIKQEYGDTNMKLDTESSNDANLIDIENQVIIKQEKHDDNSCTEDDFCNEGFAQPSPEMLIHTSEKPFQCDVCSKSFALMSNLRAHKRLHTGEKPYKCDICAKSFTQSTHLKRHKLVHTSEKPFNCDICEGNFKSVESLKVHKLLHKGDKPHACEYCNKCFSRLSYLKKHKVIHTNEKLHKCDICGKRFNHFTNLTSHKRLHTSEKQYQCDICNKRFSILIALKNHQTVHTGAKPYHCDMCYKCFAQSHHLRGHKRTHTGERPYQCNVCNMCFSQSTTLATHKLKHTGEKPYRCDVCDKGFAQSSNLTAHKRIHTGEKPYQCDVCNKRFTLCSHLNSHKRTHTGLKPYQCDICNKCFSQSNTLTCHKLKHTGEKPYRCDVCEKCFSQISNLNTHKRTHSGVKPYQCDVCKKRFTVSSHLNSHKRTHTGERPYQCDVCNKCFTQSNSLACHKRTHTG